MKLRSLEGRDAVFAGCAWLLAPAVEASLAAVGLQRTLRWIESLSAVAAERASLRLASDLSSARAKWLVDATYKVHLVRGSCLPRSLLQYGLLRGAGRAVRLVVGVRKGVSLEAHAWVEDLHDEAPATTADGFESILVAPSDPRVAA